MSISGLKKEIPTLAGEARAIRGLTQGSPQQGLAARLTEEIAELNKAVEIFERGEYNPEATAEIIGEDMQKIANTATQLSTKTAGDIHKRLNEIFKLLKKMKEEGVRHENPLIVKWLKVGVRKATPIF